MIKKILGGLVIGGMFMATTSVVLAAPPCSAVPQALKDAWSGLTAENQNYYISYYCQSGSGSTGGSGSTVGGTLSANTQLKNPIKYDNFSAFAAAVTKTAVQVLLPFIVLAFIYSGFLFVKAQGNEKELEEAKNAIWYSMIGAFVLLGAWGFAQIIGQTVSTLTQ